MDVVWVRQMLEKKKATLMVSWKVTSSDKTWAYR